MEVVFCLLEASKHQVGKFVLTYTSQRIVIHVIEVIVLFLVIVILQSS